MLTNKFVYSRVLEDFFYRALSQDSVLLFELRTNNLTFGVQHDELDNRPQIYIHAFELAKLAIQENKNLYNAVVNGYLFFVRAGSEEAALEELEDGWRKLKLSYKIRFDELNSRSKEELIRHILQVERGSSNRGIAVP